MPLARVYSLPGHALSAEMTSPSVKHPLFKIFLGISHCCQWAPWLPALLLAHRHGAVTQRKDLPRHISMQNQLPPGKNLCSLPSRRLHPANKIPDLFVPNLSHRDRGLQRARTLRHPPHLLLLSHSLHFFFFSCNFYHVPASALLRASGHGGLLPLGSLPPRWRPIHPCTGISGNSLKMQGQHSAGTYKSNVV